MIAKGKKRSNSEFIMVNNAASLGEQRDVHN
jgi:hypothetical protein